MVDVYFLNAKKRFSNGSQRAIKNAIFDYCREAPSSLSVCDMTIGIEGSNCGKIPVGRVLDSSNMIIGFDHELFPANTESMLDSLHTLLAQTSFRMMRSQHVGDEKVLGDQLVSYGLAQKFVTALGFEDTVSQVRPTTRQLDDAKLAFNDWMTSKLGRPGLLYPQIFSALGLDTKNNVDVDSMETLFFKMGDHVVEPWVQKKGFDVADALRVQPDEVLGAWREHAFRPMASPPQAQPRHLSCAAYS